MFNTSAKVLELTALIRKCNAWRVKGDQVVLTVGHFAQLDTREIDLLEEAHSHGHRLVVVLVPTGDETADAHIQRRVAALFVTDAVLVAATDEIEAVLQQLNPEVLANGIDLQAPVASLPEGAAGKVVSL